MSFAQISTDQEIENNCDTIFLNQKNCLKWKKFCDKLDLSNDEFFEILLKAYHADFNENDSNSSIVKNILLSNLNAQRRNNDCHCDFIYKITEVSDDDYHFAHRCILKSVFGEKFFCKLTDFLKNQSEYDHLNGKGGKSVENADWIVPLYFENLVEFCYTGQFGLTSNDFYLIDSLKVFIQNIVQESKTKEILLQKLNDLENNDFFTKHENSVSTVSDVLPIDNESQEVSIMNIANNFNLSSDYTCMTFSSKESKTDSVIQPPNNEIINIEMLNSPSSSTISMETSSNTCTHCNECFPTRAQLLKHVRYEHNSKPSLQKRHARIAKSKISNCNDFNSVKNRRSLSVKRDKPIGICCEKEYFNKFSFGEHILREHSAVFAACSECKELVLLNELIDHYQAAHNFGLYPEKDIFSQINPHSITSSNSATINVIDAAIQIVEKPQIINSSSSVSNQIISIASEVPNSSHNLWHKDTTCFSCNKQMSTLDYVKHLKSQLELALTTLQPKSVNLHKVHRCLLFQCQLCQSTRTVPEKAIRLYLLLTKHITRYHETGSSGDEKVACDICGNLVVKFYLKNHKKAHMLGQTNSLKTMRVACDICGKSINKKRISVHRRTHFEKFPCQYCSKVFNRKENLRVHERIHTGERPFVCDICGKGFHQYVELRLHNRKHEKDTSQFLTSAEPNKFIGQPIIYLSHSHLVE